MSRELYKEEFEIIHNHFSEEELKKILSPTENKEVIRYYKFNVMAYNYFFSRAGYMHVDLNGDFEAQTKVVEQHMHHIGARKVLELGAGNGSNSHWLAARNPEVEFVATDLMNPGRPHRLPNVRQVLSDYHLLDAVPDNSFDLAFGIETLCYSNTKEQMFAAIARKLRPGGLLVVFDVYSPEPETLNDDERYAKMLFDRATSVTGFVSVPQFEAVARKVGLEIVASVDYSNTLQDFTVKMARRSRKFFLSKSLYVRLVRWLLPLEVRKNAIMGLLVDVTTRHGVHSYHLHVFRKQA